MKDILKSLKINNSKFRDLNEENSQIFTERQNERVGTTSHLIASKHDVKIKTEKCFIIIPKSTTVLNAIIITKGIKKTEADKLFEMLKVSVAKLKVLKQSECQIFTEGNIKNQGALSQSFAIRCDFKIKTEVCWIVIPRTSNAFKAVIVKRV